MAPDSYQTSPGSYSEGKIGWERKVAPKSQGRVTWDEECPGYTLPALLRVSANL